MTDVLVLGGKMRVIDIKRKQPRNAYELENIPMNAAMGRLPTNLENLAYNVLCDAAGIDSINANGKV